MFATARYVITATLRSTMPDADDVTLKVALLRRTCGSEVEEKTYRGVERQLRARAMDAGRSKDRGP